jgi:hypothetical protein
MKILGDPNSVANRPGVGRFLPVSGKYKKPLTYCQRLECELLDKFSACEEKWIANSLYIRK